MSTEELAIREDGRQTTTLTNEQLQYIAATEFVPPGLRGNLPAILACVATGRAVGIADMTALRSIHIIDGKPTFSAELMVQLVRAAGHSITGQVSDGEAVVVGTRIDNGDTMTSTWTRDMAERAGLLSKQNWRKYPEAMLWARAVSQLCRMLFADCFAGATYTPEELEADPPERLAMTVEATPIPNCTYCGSLHWTLDTYKRLTHKCGCPHRTDPWCQAHPEGCDDFTDIRNKTQLDTEVFACDPDESAGLNEQATLEVFEPMGSADPVAEEPKIEVATKKQQDLLSMTAREAGITQAHRYDLTEQICGEGIRSVKRVPKDKVDELLAAFNAPANLTLDELVGKLRDYGNALQIIEVVDSGIEQHGTDREWLERQLARLKERYEKEQGAA